MKLKHRLILALAAFFAPAAALTSCSSNNAADSKYEKLFNGRNFDGWYKFVAKRNAGEDPKNVFTIVDSMIRISGEEWGCITTDREFGNYKIAIEFKWGDKTFGGRAKKSRDSGFLFSSNGKDGEFAGLWMPSLEVNINEGGTGDFWIVDEKGKDFSVSSTVSKDAPANGKGRVFLRGGEPYTIAKNSQFAIYRINHDPDTADIKGFRAKDEPENPHGEWNLLECELRDGHIKVWLNGKLVNEGTFTPKRGKIQLQSEGAEIFYRRVDIKEL